MAFKSDGLSTKSDTFLLLFETSRLSGGPLIPIQHLISKYEHRLLFLEFLSVGLNLSQFWS